MKRLLFAMPCAVASMSAFAASLSGSVEWGGREPHLAVVNPVCGNEPGTVLDLGGEWTFSTCGFADDRSQFFNMRQHKEPWPKERKIMVPGTWESQGVGRASLRLAG
ncbi:MAG: hypothetical protein IKQ17_10870 [Kiritimatiellae bacterium]|nr:hypothetical protein [Kiritimatiellia bacterium]